MASKIKVDNIENQCGGAVVTKCGATTTISGSVVKADDIQAADGGNLINQCGTTITLGASGDTINLASGASQSGFGRTGTVDWQTDIKTSDFTAVSGEGYFVNTTSGVITVTLPASPSAGAIVSIKDYLNTADTNAITIARNGSNIDGATDDVEMTTEGIAVTLIYADATQGWVVVNSGQRSDLVIPPAYITATGGTITTVCTNYKVHTFTGPGTFEITAGSGDLSKLDYLVLAGGGGGGAGEPNYWTGGGGGAGGFRESKTSAVSGCWSASPLASSTPLGPFSSPLSIPVTVGAAGSAGITANPGCGSTAGGQGGNSIFSTITSTGGGGGGVSTGDASGTKPARFGQPGGSGGGSGGGADNPIGNGNTPPVSPPQGQNGGKGAVPTAGRGGGGGGAGGTGGSYPCGSGGAGVASSITSSPVTRAVGGSDGTGTAGGTNEGDGGGSNINNGNAGAGGSGIVIIRYRFQ
jgi:hypothetical protein